MGPTVKIFDTMTDSIGLYFQNFFRMSFRAAAFDETKRAWINQWTIFTGHGGFPGHLLWRLYCPYLKGRTIPIFDSSAFGTNSP
ncbi:MAG: BCCT family transporter [Streptococcus salivarius]